MNGFGKLLLYRRLWDNNLVKEVSNTLQIYTLSTEITDRELQLRKKEIKLLLLLLLSNFSLLSFGWEIFIYPGM